MVGVRRRCPDFFRWARFSQLGPAFEEFAASGDWSRAVLAAIGDDVPPGLALVSITSDGVLSARRGPGRPVIVGGTVNLDVVIDSRLDHDAVVTVADEDVPVPAGGAGLSTLELDTGTASFNVSYGAEVLAVEEVAIAVDAAVLRLTSLHGARWSVSDSTGGAWFAEGFLASGTRTTSRSSIPTPARSRWPFPRARCGWSRRGDWNTSTGVRRRPCRWGDPRTRLPADAPI